MSEMNLQKIAESAIREKLATEVLRSITTEDREAILRKSIEAALSDYAFRGMVEKAVVDQAAEQARKLIRSDAWKKRIDDVIEAAFERLMGQLGEGMVLAMAEAFAGRAGKDTYDRAPGILLKHLRLTAKE